MLLSLIRRREPPPAREEARLSEPIQGLGAKAVFPVHIAKYEEFLENARSWIEVAERIGLGKVSRETLQQVVDMAVAILTPWTTHGGIVVSIASKEAFKNDMKRKLIGMAETAKVLIVRELEACTEVMKRIHSPVATAVVAGGVGAEMAESDKQIREAVKSCLDSLNKTRLVIPAFLVSLDIVLGVVQSNLPASLMSNVIKGRVGFITD